MSWLTKFSAAFRNWWLRAKYGPPGSANHTAAFREFFRSHESAWTDGPVPDDELRDLLFFWFQLECADCGRMDEFLKERDHVDERQEKWAWEFAKLAVIQARAAGWTAGPDEQGFPQAYCGECSIRRRG
jgi:hypothetical protein